MSQPGTSNDDQLSDASDTDINIESAKVPVRKRTLAISPSMETPMKRHNSLPDVSHPLTQTQTPAQSKISRWAKSATPKSKTKVTPTSTSFADSLLTTFKDKSFQQGVSPLITQLISPLIEDVIKKSVSSAVANIQSELIQPLIETNRRLQGIVDEQHTLIRQQHERTTELEAHYDGVCSEIDDLKLSMNNLEQYGRRNNLRISNMFLGPPGATEADVTQRTVEFLNSDVLKESTPGSTPSPITVDDIDRCHPIGPMRGGKLNVIVKFHRYATKRTIFQAKRNLKGDIHRRYITEDLTRNNYNIVQTLVRYKRGGEIDAFWTRDGSIFAKKHSESRPLRIRSDEDVNELLGRNPQHSNTRFASR